MIKTTVKEEVHKEGMWQREIKIYLLAKLSGYCFSATSPKPLQ